LATTRLWGGKLVIRGLREDLGYTAGMRSFFASVGLCLLLSGCGRSVRVDHREPVDPVDGGQGGGPPLCTPGAPMSCYSGPAGTENVGVCRAGQEVCLQPDDASSACLGEVVPTAEDCHSHADEDCDGESYCAGSMIAAASFGSATGALGIADGAPTPDGGSVLVGVFSGTIDVGGGTAPLKSGSSEDRDVFLLKTDADGGVVCAASFGGPEENRGGAVAVDSAGDFYVAVNTWGTFEVAGQIASSKVEGSDAFLVKLRGSDCAPLWVTPIATGPKYEWAYDIAMLRDDAGLAIVGRAYDSASLGSLPPLSLEAEEGFVARFDLNGAAQAARVFCPSGPGWTTALRCAVDAGGNIVLAGVGHQGCEPGPSIESDLFIEAVDPGSLSTKWMIGIGGSGAQLPKGIAAGPNGETVVVGTSGGVLDLGPAGTLDAAGQSFVVSLNEDGTVRWAQAIVAEYGTASFDVAIDELGEILVVGVAVGTLSFPGAQEGSNSSVDTFAAQFTADGQFRHSVVLRPSLDSKPAVVGALASRDLWFVAGHYWQEMTVPLDPPKTLAAKHSVYGDTLWFSLAR
jgi:hypothetical protein